MNSFELLPLSTINLINQLYSKLDPIRPTTECKHERSIMLLNDLFLTYIASLKISSIFLLLPRVIVT